LSGRTFDRVAGEAEDRLGAHEEPVLAAADAYSYLLHLLLVSGIIVSAIGLKAAVGHVAGLWCAFLPVGGDPPQ
jgi:low temperature requirement protein LtrA